MHGDQLITLQGEINLAPKQAQLQQFKWMQTTNEVLALYMLQIQTQEENYLTKFDLPAEIELKLALLLQNCSDIFQAPQGLPPKRFHEHSINLLPSITPIKVRPYRYPHSQKMEIKKVGSRYASLRCHSNKYKPIFDTCVVSEKEGWYMEILY